MEALPHFRYHPNPIATGAVVADDFICIVCNKPRHHRYQGPIHTTHQTDEPICPWCIANGTAAHALTAVFTDPEPLAELSPEIHDIVTKRTPGYTGWQQEVWLNHCDDACIYLGPIGKPELETLPQSATKAVTETLSTRGAVTLTVPRFSMPFTATVI